MHRVRARLGLIGAVALLGVAAPASASAAKLSLSVKGLTIAPIAGNLRLPAQQIGRPATLAIKATGSLPAGTKLRLATRAYSTAPFKLQPGTIKLHHGAAKLRLVVHKAATIGYRLELLSGSHVVATSGVRSIFWITPPPDLVVTDGGDNATLHLTTDKLTGCSSPGGPTTCDDISGQGAGGEVVLQAYTDTDRLAGTKVTLSFNGQPVCSTTKFDGQCRADVTMPGVPANTYIPATATYTDPSGRTFTVTLNIEDYYNPSVP